MALKKKPDSTDTEEAGPDTTASPLLVEDGKLFVTGCGVHSGNATQVA